MTVPTPNNPDPVGASTPQGRTPIRQGGSPPIEQPAGSGNDSGHTLAEEINGSEPITADGPDPEKFPADVKTQRARELIEAGRDEQGRFISSRAQRLGSVPRDDSTPKEGSIPELPPTEAK
jgi:hypothetical protein